MDLDLTMERVVRVFELAGVAVLSFGAAVAFVRYFARRDWSSAGYDQLRRDLGRAILLGLEILVAADIIRTVAVDPTIESAVTLGVIVLVRTLLSFSLEIELEGVAPWRRRAAQASRHDGE
ncbi:MAG: DUF1622 domain-containing protein [Actinomycetota bacterium]